MTSKDFLETEKQTQKNTKSSPKKVCLMSCSIFSLTTPTPGEPRSDKKFLFKCPGAEQIILMNGLGPGSERMHISSNFIMKTWVWSNALGPEEKLAG